MSERASRSGQASIVAVLAAICVAAAIPLVALTGQNQQFANLAITASLACSLIGLTMNATMRAPFLVWALTPVGMMLCFMMLAFGVVPTLWTLGLVEPWSEVRGREYSASAAGILLLVAFVIGVWVCRPRFERHQSQAPVASPNLSVFLVGCCLIGITGYFLLAVAAGGPMALLHSLADRRDSLAGTGPLRALLLVAAVGCVAGVAHLGKSAAQTRLTWLCGLTYFGLNLMTGARIQALIVVIAAFAVYVRLHGSNQAVARRVALALAVAIPASTFYALRIRQGLTYGTDVQVIDDSSSLKAVASIIGPFVNGGVDSLRTLGVVAEGAPTASLNLAPVVGSFTNVVPRSLWADKPHGSATEFSARYFPDRWADGTGVPPSISAEFMNTFGYVGGLLAMAVLGFVVAFGSATLYRKSSLWALVVFALLTADSLQLVKGGSDGFVRSVTMQLVALVIAMAWAKLARLNPKTARQVQRTPRRRIPRSPSPVR